MLALVNADDLGHSTAVNDAIFAAYDRGLLVSTTLLVHGPAFRGAVHGLRARPRLRMGVHLDSSEFAPREVDRFTAWCDQVARARDAGLDPLHLDAHHHAHFEWRALPALVRVLQATGIRRIRGRSLDHGPALRSRAWRAILARFAAMPDHFVSVDRWLRLGAPERPGVTELMVHPGNPHHARYADEMAAVARLAKTWNIIGFDALGGAGVQSQGGNRTSTGAPGVP